MRRIANLVYLLLTLALSMCSCASDQRLVRDAVAARDYYQARYTRLCVAQVGPSTCKPCQVAANELRSELTAANEAQKTGHLPKTARKTLKAATKKLEATCP